MSPQRAILFSHSSSYYYWSIILLSGLATIYSVPWTFVNGLAVSNHHNYDVVIIGGGSAGLTAAKVASTFGKSCVIVEQARMGGDCTWTGCIPSKSLIAASKAAYTIQTAQQKFGGISCGQNVQIDMKAIRDIIQQKIQHIYDEDDSPEAMKQLGIDTIVGQRATFVDSKTIQLSSVDKNKINDNPTSLVHANMGIIIATGATPIEPTNEMIEGISDVSYLTYEQIFDLTNVPKRLTVIGGGPIGCELAQAFSRLGSTVTQVAKK